VCGDANERADGGASPGKSSLFLLTQPHRARNRLRRRSGGAGRQSGAGFAPSGALATLLENARESIIFTPGRTVNRIRTPRWQASSFIEERDQGKSAN